MPMSHPHPWVGRWAHLPGGDTGVVCSSYSPDPINNPQSRFGYGYVFCLVVGLVSPHPLPTHPLPTHPLPTHPLPTHPLPTHPLPTHPLPTHPLPTHPLPTHPLPTHPKINRETTLPIEPNLM
uniref:Uncharacterized protein n=1 Tax=Human herpesvirus 1 TaxID=10298 RepID=A0A2U9A4Y5_HHV1|nr:hypothetical protein [Human alphaherpesvirus 1]AWO69970.1 hypothetical protein [Human alphaherpesvirus 1]